MITRLWYFKWKYLQWLEFDVDFKRKCVIALKYAMFWLNTTKLKEVKPATFVPSIINIRNDADQLGGCDARSNDKVYSRR